jgi:DHA1 family bicyclomycin/chloramphenicol resistance-like MFS transporter
MRLRTDSSAFTLLLALLTAIGPVSIDIYLPSLPSMVDVFHTTSAGAEATVTAYYIGFALAQVIYGPISDRLGRRPVLLVGLAFYVAASLVCVLAPTLEALIVARVVQAVAAAAPIILARTIVRDLHSGIHAGRLLSVMSSIMGVVPIVAPAVGGFLALHLGWRSNFWVMTAAGAFAFAAVALVLPETIGDRRAARLSPASILASYRFVLASGTFRLYAAIVCLAYGGLITYIGVSSFIVQGSYGLSPVGYGITFAVSSVGYIAGTFFGRSVAARRGLSRAVGAGSALLGVGGILLPTAVVLAPAQIVEFIIPTVIYMAGIGVIIPQGIAAALTPFPERAGAASSLIGFLHMTTAAVVLAAAGALFGDAAFANAGVLAVTGLLAVVIFLAGRRIRSAVPA